MKNRLFNMYRFGIIIAAVISFEFIPLVWRSTIIQPSIARAAVGQGMAVDLDLTTTGYDATITTTNIENTRSVQEGDEFDVGIVVQNGYNADSITGELLYDKTRLTFVSGAMRDTKRSISNFLVRDGGTLVEVPVVTRVDNGQAIVVFGGAIRGQDPLQAPDGSGLVAWVTFRAIASGTAELSLHNGVIVDSYNNAEMVNRFANGLITVSAISNGTPTVTPTPYYPFGAFPSYPWELPITGGMNAVPLFVCAFFAFGYFFYTKKTNMRLRSYQQKQIVLSGIFFLLLFANFFQGNDQSYLRAQVLTETPIPTYTPTLTTTIAIPTNTVTVQLGAISGIVTEGAIPKASIVVSALNSITGQVITSTQSGTDGTYVLAGITPGNYKVKFEGSGITGAIYYYNRYTFIEAALLSIFSGQTTAGVNLDITSATGATPSVTPYSGIASPTPNAQATGTASAYPTVSSSLVTADFTGDGKVYTWDLSLFADHYLTATGDANWDTRFDLQQNNRVDSSDLGVLQSNWLRGVYP